MHFSLPAILQGQSRWNEQTLDADGTKGEAEMDIESNDEDKAAAAKKKKAPEPLLNEEEQKSRKLAEIKLLEMRLTALKEELEEGISEEKKSNEVDEKVGVKMRERSLEQGDDAACQ